MNKRILCCVSAFIGIYYSFGADYSQVIIKKDPLTTLSLRSSITKPLFFLKSDQQKEELNQKLKDKIIIPESLRFEGLIVEHLDLSEMHLQYIDFSGGTFNNVKFNGSDLTGAQFNKADLSEANLTGAILCPLDDLGHPILEKTFTLKSGDHYQLVNQYSNLMKESKADQAQCLNKLFPALSLFLFESNLKKFNLIDIGLENANLQRAKLQGAILSQNVTVPNYAENDRSELFKLWCGEDPEYQQAFQKLVNAQFNIIEGVDYNTLIEGLKLKNDLKNAYLENTYLPKAHFIGASLQNATLQNAVLQEANFTGANLQNTNLWGADLEGADFTGANLTNAQLQSTVLQGANLTDTNLENALLINAQLQGAILSENVIVSNYPEENRKKLFKAWCYGKPEQQQAYQKLVNARFDIIEGVDHKTLIEGIKLKKDLRNADLRYAELQEADLTGANLENACLSNISLQGADLTGAKLGGAVLSESFKFPTDCKDKDLLEIYKSCTDQEAQPILKQILKAKKIPLE